MAPTKRTRAENMRQKTLSTPKKPVKRRLFGDTPISNLNALVAEVEARRNQAETSQKRYEETKQELQEEAMKLANSIVLDKMIEDLSCSICLNVVQDPVSPINCAHIYCRTCMTLWFNKKHSCPTCRRDANAFRPVSQLQNISKMLNDYKKKSACTMQEEDCNGTFLAPDISIKCSCVSCNQRANQRAQENTNVREQTNVTTPMRRINRLNSDYDPLIGNASNNSIVIDDDM
ncbi:hypothetical protein CsNV_018 [Callinectes sapidus nudivirus]|nr:hypothetical protein CsNV_018 [Callinectes sapidus nudivirus]